MELPVIAQWWPVVRADKVAAAGPVRPVWLVLTPALDGQVAVLLDGQVVGWIGKGSLAAALACTSAGPVRCLGSVGDGRVELGQVRVLFADRLPEVADTWRYDDGRKVWGPVSF